MLKCITPHNAHCIISTIIHQISTIFKTIDNETSLSGQKIVSVLQARKIAQEQAIKQTNLDIQCLRNYEAACKNGTVTSEDFTRIMGKASSQAQDYSKNIKDGTGSAQVYADKQKTLQQSIKNTGTASQVAAVGIKALSIAGNMLAGMAISFAISKVIEGIEYLATASERAIEKTKELQEEISQISSDYQSERQTLEGLREEYNSLTAKIGENGAEASLSADEYERYRDITSEILGITPKLITGWDDEGRAISNKNGLLQQSIDLLDEGYQKSLRNSTTKSKNEEIAAGIIESKNNFDNSVDTKTKSGTMADMRESFLNELEKLETQLGMTEHDIVEKMWVYFDLDADTKNFWSNHVDTYEELRNLISSDYDKLGNSFTDENNPIYELFSDEVIDEMIQKADEYFQELARIESEEQQYYQQYKDQLNLNAQAVGDAYNSLSDETKAGITQMIDSFDYSDMTKDKFSDMAIDLKDFVGKLSTDGTLLSYFDNLFKPMGEDESIEDYEKRVQTGIDNITSYCKANYPAIKLSFGDIESDVDDLKEKYNATLDRFKDEETQSLDELKTKYQEAIDKRKELYSGEHYVGNVDINNRPVVINDDGSYSTTSTSFQEKWIGDEETGSYKIVHYTPILPDGTILEDDALNEYIDKILNSSDSLKADNPANGGYGIVYKVDTEVNGQKITDENLDTAFGIADAWDVEMHETQDKMYRDEAEFKAAIERFGSDSSVDLEKFFTDNSINTEEEIDYFNKVTEGAKTASEAIEMYNKVKSDTFNNETTISNVFALKDSSDTATALSNLKDQLSEVETAYQTCLSAKEEYDKQGYLSVDTLEKVISLGDEYLQYLFDEEGQVNLDAEAFQNLALARINAMETQTLSNLAENIKQITNEATATDYLAKKQNELADSYTDVAASALIALHSIDGFSDSEALQNAYDSFKAQYEQIKGLFAKTKAGLTQDFSGSSNSEKSISDTSKDYIESYMDFQEKSLEKGIISYNTYSSTISNLLKKMWKDGKISAKEYYDYTGKLLDNQKSIYDKVLSAVQRRFDKEINAIEESISAIEKQNDALEKQKDNYDKVISTVVKYLESLQDELDKDIELIEDENNVLQDQIDMYDGLLNAVSTVFDEQREAAQSEIDLLQERIDKLQEANDEENRAIELQKARAELERARNQRTKLVYTHENGFVYQSDDTAIREAESNLADLEFESTINALEKEKELLQDIIDQLDEAEEKWSDIADAFDKKKNLSIAEQIFGENYKEIILASDPQVIEDIMNKYVSAQEKMEDNETTIESIEAKKKKYDELITKWEQVAKKQEETTNREITSLILGKDWQKLVLEDRTADYDNFCEEYLSIQEKILDNEAEIASLEEKKTIYENLKQEWSDISSAYEDSIEDQYAAMILGKNWESSIFDERRIVLNNFKNDYEMIQRQIADAAWNSANEQVKAAQTALEALNKLREESKYSTAGSVNTIITKPSSPNKDMIQFYHDGIKSGIVGKGQSSKQKHEVLKRASTGLLTDEIPAILQKGEVVLTRVQQNNLAENLMRKPIILNHENMFKNNLPDYSKLSDTVVKPINSYSIGEVNVTCPGITSDDVAKQIGSAIKREFNGLSLMATQKMSITR